MRHNDYSSIHQCVHVSFANMEEAGFMTSTAANHQGAIEIWLHSLVTSSVVVASRCFQTRVRDSLVETQH